MPTPTTTVDVLESVLRANKDRLLNSAENLLEEVTLLVSRLKKEASLGMLPNCNAWNNLVVDFAHVKATEEALRIARNKDKDA